MAMRIAKNIILIFMLPVMLSYNVFIWSNSVVFLPCHFSSCNLKAKLTLNPPLRYYRESSTCKICRRFLSKGSVGTVILIRQLATKTSYTYHKFLPSNLLFTRTSLTILTTLLHLKAISKM